MQVFEHPIRLAEKVSGRIELSGTADELRENTSVEEAYLGLAVQG